MDRIAPVVAVFNSNDDVVPPYDRSWRFLEHLRDAPAIRGRQFVITSTNARRVQEPVGSSDIVYEIVGKPYDINRIVTTVKEAARSRPVRD